VVDCSGLENPDQESLKTLETAEFCGSEHAQYALFTKRSEVGDGSNAGTDDLLGDDRLDLLIRRAHAIIDEALELHPASHVFGMFSGGHDSLCSSHVASLHPAFSGVAHINTTIGVEETRQFVRETAARYGWSLKEYTSPVSYREIVLKHGFPGPGGHLFMYTRLKERCIERLVREHKTHWKDRIGMVTGVRLSESVRRMGNVEPIQRKGGKLWIAPILHWTDEDKDTYMTRFQLVRNPVVARLCMSGECLCGAFAKAGELTALKYEYPEAAKVILDLQEEAAAAGVHADWGTRPPGKRKAPTLGGMLCSDCNQRNFTFMEEAA
jgi:3'-phosphoadenosine 5'-phosphosulfate sulfotransferase (PAPS reductase)/FAD synthetase